MAGAVSNFPEVRDAIMKFGSVMNLNRPMMGGARLGDVALRLVAVGIRNRTLAEQGQPDGKPLAKNRGRYGKAKRRRNIKIGIGYYPPDGVGGEMLSLDQLEGVTGVSKEAAVMIYGKNEDARQKAEWFTEGNAANNQPPRPFYELNKEIIKDLDDFFDAATEDYFEDIARSP